MLGGGVLFAATAGLVAAASGFWTFLVAEVLSYPASGALVGLGQASLMDVGVVVAPLALIAILHLGGTWRWQFAALAVVTLVVVVASGACLPRRGSTRASSTGSGERWRSSDGARCCGGCWCWCSPT